jgi:putative transposase
MAVMIAGRQFWLAGCLTTKAMFSACSCNDGGKLAALRLMRKLLKKQGFSPVVLGADKLPSYSLARAQI